MKPDDPEDPDPEEEEEEELLAAAGLSFDKVKPPMVPWEEVGMATALVAAARESVSVSYTAFQVRPSFSPE
jgi:hypothetical protein